MREWAKPGGHAAVLRYALVNLPSRTAARTTATRWAPLGDHLRASMSSGRSSGAIMAQIYQIRAPDTRTNKPLIHSLAVGGRAARAFTLRQSRPAKSASNWA